MFAVTQTTYGTADRLSLVEVDAPTVGDRDVLVDIYATAVTQGDRRIRTGNFPGITFVPGRLAIGLTGPRARTAGTAFAGRVVATGAAVTRFAVGDDVFGSVLAGAQAEQIAVPEDGGIARMPGSFTYDEAAALGYGGMTALQFLVDKAKLVAGERICIIGASGGVGRIAVQLAAHLGAHVTAVCSAEHAGLVRSLGASEVLDYRTDDLAAHPRPFDVVFDTVGASSLAASRSVLNRTGRYVSLIVTPALVWQMLTARWRGPKAVTGAALATPEGLDRVSALADAGAFRPVIAHTLPLQDVRAAHGLLDAGNPGGDVVLTVGTPDVAASAA